MPEFKPSEPDELPPVSADLVLLRVSIEAFIATMPRKKSEKFLRLVSEKLASEDNLSSVFMIRPTSQHMDVQRARRQAAAVWSRYLPIFLARVPSD